MLGPSGAGLKTVQVTGQVKGQVTGYRPQATGHRPQATGHRPQATGQITGHTQKQ